MRTSPVVLGYGALLALLGLSPDVRAGQDAAGAVIRGRIVDGSGGVAATVEARTFETPTERGARTAASEYLQKPALSISTDADGHFEMRLPDRAHLWGIEAVAPGHARAIVAESVGPVDQTLGPTRLWPGGIISGRVVDRAGKPVTTAVVLIDKWRQLTAAHVDTGGRFAVEGAFTVGGTLTVRAAGFAPHRETRRGLGDGVAITLDPAASVSGRVVDGSGNGVAGVQLFVRDEPGGPCAISGPDGAFTLGDLGPGPVDLATRSDRFRAASCKARAPGAAPVILKLEQAGVIDITVVDKASRAPIPGVAIERDQAVVAGTDGGGRSLISGLADGNVTIITRHAAYLPEQRNVVIAPPQTTRLTIELSPAAAVEGSVIGEDGNPIAGATVEVGAIAKSVFQPEFRSFGPESETSIDGRFRLVGLLDRAKLFETLQEQIQGGFLLRASAFGHARQEVALPEVAPGKVVREVRVVLAPAGAIASHVVDVRGRPVTGARVDASAPGSFDRYDWQTSDGNGWFEAGSLPDGKIEIAVTATGYLEKKACFSLANRAHATVPDIVLERAPVITGTVRNRGGDPVEASVQCSSGDIESDRTGAFALTVDYPEHEIEVFVNAKGYVQWRRTVVLAEASPLDVVLEDERRLRGLVGARADGRPVPRFDVEIMPFNHRDGADWVREHVADDGGRFDVGGLPGGKVRLTVKAPGYLDETIEEIDLDEPDRGAVNVLLDRGLSVEGTVRSRDRKPRAGVHVHARAWEPSRWDFTTSEGEPGVVSAADGRFRLDAVHPGKLWLIAMADGRPPTVQSFDVDAAAQDLEVVLDDGATVSGRVVDHAGAPVRAVVTSEFRDGPAVATGEDGSFSFKGMAPGAYDFRAQTRDGTRSSVVRVHIGTKDPAPILLVLRELGRGVSVDVTLTGLDAATLARTELSAYSPDADLTGRRDGQTLRIGGVPPGDLTLTADLDGRTIRKVVEVTGVEPSVQLVWALAAGSRLSGRITKRGAAVDGADLWIETRGLDGVAFSGASKADGSYVLGGLPDGLHELRISADPAVPAGVASHVYSVAIAGDTHLDIELPSGVLEGLVLDSAGKVGLAEARVLLAPDDLRDFDRVAGRAVSDTAGRFRIEDVGAGSFVLWADAEGHASAAVPVTLPADDAVRIELDPEAALRLHVIDRRTGEPPLASAVVIVDRAGNLAGFTTAERDGDDFVVANLPRGTVSLVVHASDAAPATVAGVTVPGEASVDLLTGGTLVVRSATPATVEVRRADGAPGYAAQLRSLRRRFDVMPPKELVGAFAPGEYRIVVVGASGRSVPATIRDCETTTVTLPP
ncbi:MAG: hypothetical protein U0166_14885 [Acidobacteriota bacterium]